MTLFDYPNLSSLLDSNAAPTSAEVVLVEEALVRLTNELNIRRTRLHATECEIHRYQAILSPVRRLPPELLGEILLLLTPPIPNHEERSRLLELATVCTLWREASLLTHRLWNGLAINGSTPESAYDRVLLWFQRSGSLPRSLHFEADPRPCGCEEEYPTECVATRPLLIRLLSEGPRLAHFDFNLTSLTCLGNAIDSIKAYSNAATTENRPWDNIQILRLCFNTSEYKQQWHDPTDREKSILSHLPHVQSFHLELPPLQSTMSYSDNSRTMTLSSITEFVSHLTVFTIRWDCAGNKLFDILRNCANVEALTIDLSHTQPNNDHYHDRRLALSNPPVVLPKVTTLRLRRSSTDILEHLQTPSLVQLDLGLNGDVKEREQCIGVVSCFLLRSGVVKSVRYLRVHAAPVHSVDLRTLLCSLRGLEHLALDNVDFDGLLFAPPTGAALPSLTTIELINIPRHYNVSLDLFLLQLKEDHLSCCCTVTASNIEGRTGEPTDCQKKSERISERCTLGWVIRGPTVQQVPLLHVIL
ncbi:hypothetical protein DFP72DRAFT_863187 [Ephemerocybe angulata]|uniref:F-box domain-containing protein n=1 Tax=Ephemerocybe angulata TaxID=980116 RepID=A0A8H6H5Y6_9AGAR|nr:hypothetical protein DFP72DRAFT_863187 [Tulosesus angulatus]